MINVSSIEPFKPFRFLPTGHAQTIYASLTARSALPDSIENYAIRLADEDCVLVHECGPAASDLAGPPRVALLFHGLGGCFRSPYLLRLASKLVQRNVRVFGIDSRGCGLAAHWSRNLSHAGRTDDFHASVESIAHRFADARVTLVGFSLGGNTLLSYLGKFASSVPSNVVNALAIAPPIDLVRCTRSLKNGLSRFYDYYYARNMMRQLRWRRTQNPRLHDRRIDQSVETVVDFDRQFTAPLAGFGSVWDYYESSSAIHQLPHIDVPTKIIADAHDPVVPAALFEDGFSNPRIETHMTRRGGHLGYYADEPISGDRWWLDSWICHNILAA